MSEYYDTYFLDATVALKNALKNHNVMAANKIVSGLQICYYDGNKIDNAPMNCINVPFDSMVDYFSTTKNRLPTVFDTTNCSLGFKDIESLKDKFYENIEKVNKILKAKIKKLHSEIKNLKLNFQDKTLRIFAYGCRETVLIKYLVENIISAFNDLEYETLLYKQTNDIQSCSEVFYLEAIRDFNPHITININHLNNQFLNDDVFNFVWFQDVMPILANDIPIRLRERDFVFHISSMLERKLKQKDISSYYQPFCINKAIYKRRDSINRENKIVFIGSSYKGRIEKIKDDYDFEKIYNNMLVVFNQKGCLTNPSIENSDIKYFADKYNKPVEYIGEIYAYMGRDYCIEKLCKLNTNYKLEVYGHGWSDNEIVAPYYKGIVEYGKEISKIYNSAIYGYCPGGYVLMQRTLESVFSGAIPLVLDVRADKDDVYDAKVEESVEFFTVDTLKEILNKQPKKCNFYFMTREYSYDNFIQNCVSIINNIE